MSTNKTLEQRLADWIGGFGPWLAPIPSAALVFHAMQVHFAWATTFVAFCAAAVIEVLGFSSINTALMLNEWNGRRPEKEKPAPFWIAALIVGVYLLTTIGLTVVLDLDDQLVKLAPALFPIMALVGSVNIALRTQHTQRLARLSESDRQARADAEKAKADRQAEREEKRKAVSSKPPSECKTLLDFENFADVKVKTKAWLVLRQLVYERDNETCQDCGKGLSHTGFHCHHIKEALYGGLGKPSNLTTLCEECHAKRHGDQELFTRPKNAKIVKHDELQQALLDTLLKYGDVGATELGRLIGTSRQTVYTYLDELEQAGRVHKNGNGWEVNP